MVSEFYASGLDTARIEAEGLAPIKDLLQSIDQIKAHADVWKVVASLHKEDFCHPFFSFGADHDAKNSSWVVAQMFQSGLGLPDRDFYGKWHTNRNTLKGGDKRKVPRSSSSHV
jgi:putative endopeptidase